MSDSVSGGVTGGVSPTAIPAAPEPRVRARRLPGVPVVSIRVLALGGARAEQIPGQAYLAGRMLGEGTARWDFRRWADELEGRGMMLTSAGSWEGHGLALDALSGDWERALDWVAELLLEPSFPAERTAWLRRQIEAEIDSFGDRPEVRCAWAFNQQLYAPHPRGRRLQGDAASLRRLESDDCRAFHRTALARGLVVTVAGEIDEEAVRTRLERLLGGAERGPAPPPLELPAPRGGKPRRRLALDGSDQAHLLLGHLTVPRTHPDYAALELLAVVLGAGSGLTGRIPARIREREGLAYTATAQTVSGAGIDPGQLVFYVGTAPETVRQAEASCVDELTLLLAEGVNQEELDDARSYLLGREPFERETAGQWARLLTEATIYDLPLDNPTWRRDSLLALDTAALLAAARRHLDPSRLRATVGIPRAAPR
jgi:zinc protease